MKLSEPELNALSLLAHFGYGAASGTLYAAGKQAWPGRPATKGVIFGLSVWSASYFSLLPWAGVLTPATEHPARRNGLMIAAHVVWGAGLGLLVARTRRGVPSSAGRVTKLLHPTCAYRPIPEGSA